LAPSKAAVVPTHSGNLLFTPLLLAYPAALLRSVAQQEARISSPHPFFKKAGLRSSCFLPAKQALLASLGQQKKKNLVMYLSNFQSNSKYCK